MNKPQDPEAAETVQTTSVPAVDLPRLVRLYNWLRVEEQHGETIACGGIFPANEIQRGQRWQGSGNHVVTVTQVRPIKSDEGDIIDYEVCYQWRDSSGDKSHRKLAFAFQCRYCLILPNTKDIGA
jgi:hypothetical protein